MRASRHEDARDPRQDGGCSPRLPPCAEVQGRETTAQEGNGESEGSAMSDVVTYIIPLLYVSATQINFAVPLIEYPQVSAVKVTVNGLNEQPLVVPLESGSPHLFINGSETYLDTLSNPNWYFIPFALNADGSVNAPSS